nr:MAG TPA: NusG domain protein [Bacteriophage sp.]
MILCRLELLCRPKQTLVCSPNKSRGQYKLPP